MCAHTPFCLTSSWSLCARCLLAVNFYLPSLFVCLCQAHTEPHPVSSRLISYRTHPHPHPHTHTLSLSLSRNCTHTCTYTHTHTHTLSLLPGSHRANPLSLPPFAPLASPLGTRTHIGQKPPSNLRVDQKSTFQQCGTGSGSTTVQHRQ